MTVPAELSKTPIESLVQRAELTNNLAISVEGKVGDLVSSLIGAVVGVTPIVEGKDYQSDGLGYFSTISNALSSTSASLLRIRTDILRLNSR